jgi:hypothetical protein
MRAWELDLLSNALIGSYFVLQWSLDRYVVRKHRECFPVQKFLYFKYWRYDNSAQLGRYVLQIWHKCNVYQ